MLANSEWNNNGLSDYLDVSSQGWQQHEWWLANWPNIWLFIWLVDFKLFSTSSLLKVTTSHQLEKFLQRGCWTRPAQFRMEGQQWEKFLRWRRDGPLGDHRVVKMKQKWGVLRVSQCSSIIPRMTSSIMAFKPFISKQERSRLILKATLTGENGNRNQGKAEAGDWDQTVTLMPSPRVRARAAL